jgi:pimeloyl-ACP methyl ester carboxylesterase
VKDEYEFASSELVWKVDGIDVYGTATVPEGKGPYPGIVFVAGSGPTDRNWESPLIPGTNGSGRLLAEALSHAGFICLRYDKRASGPHVKENLPKLIGKMSMQSHLQELVGAVNALLGLPAIDKRRLLVLTSSEGAIHALHYQVQQKKNPFSGLVLTGAPGRAVGDVARSQLVEQFGQSPNGQEIMSLYDKAVKSYLAGEEVNPDPGLPEGIQNIIRSLSIPANLPFSRELWTTDPSELLARIKSPVLIVIGKKDVQVDWRADGSQLERAASGYKNVIFAYPEDANHVLKHDKTPRDEIVAAEAPKRYNSPDAHLDEEALSVILNWLRDLQ